MSNRILAMNDGKMVQLGTPDDIYKKPVNKFMADFIGRANIFDAVVKNVYDNNVEIEVEGVGITQVNTSDKFEVGDKVFWVLRPEKLLFH